MDAEALERTARRLKARLDEMEIERHKRLMFSRHLKGGGAGPGRRGTDVERQTRQSHIAGIRSMRIERCTSSAPSS
jgi:hypothetical protein